MNTDKKYNKVPFSTERDAIVAAHQPLTLTILMTEKDIAEIRDGSFLGVPINGTDISIVIGYGGVVEDATD